MQGLLAGDVHSYAPRKRTRHPGLHVTIPSEIPPAMKLHPELKEQTTVTTLNADGTVLEMAPRHAGSRTLRFGFPRLLLRDIEKNKPLTLQGVMRNPEPTGDLAITATVGPFVLSKVAQTPLSGSFDFTHANLSEFHTIGGMLASQGRFRGTLASCQLRGNAHIPDFEVTRNRHAVDLSAEFAARVDGQHGNLSIKSVIAHFLNTTVRREGAVTSASSGENGKSVTLELKTERARVEDLLRLFVKSDPPPVKGPITFKVQVQLPPGNEQFLRKVRLDGDFALVRAEFTKKQTQEKVNELGSRARGQKNSRNAEVPWVAADLKGHVQLRNATAMLSDVFFSTPGATARGGGTYDLLPETIDMRGELAMQASLSKAAGGVKSIVLMPLDPFFKRENAGAVLPFRISGNYSHPIFRMSLKQSRRSRR